MGTLIETATAYPHIMVETDHQHASRAADQNTRPARSSSHSESSSSAYPIPQQSSQSRGTPSQASSADSEATVVASTQTTNYAAHSHQQQYHPRNQPQYDQAGFPLTSQPQGLVQSSPNSPRLQPTHPSMRSLAESAATSPSRIKVRDLSHIQSFASEEYLARPRLHQRTGSSVSDSGRQYEISSMPVSDIIEMVAGLLTKITATNDRNHDHVSRPIALPEDQASMSSQTTSVLAFHGKNVPSITILSYLSRIHKYCPTTYEVFLSLLIYFDRMTEMVNRSFMQQSQHKTSSSRSATSEKPDTEAATPPSSGSMSPSDRRTPAQMPPSPPMQVDHNDMANIFVVDSFNIHRLVIAGVTCASKFFSDVFYTNSRYAKVSLSYGLMAWPRTDW